MTKKVKCLIVYLGIAIFTFGCGGSHNNGDGTTPENEKTGAAIALGATSGPDWVRKDCSSYFKEKGQKVLCGVGTVTGMADPNLARTAAQGRGRTEIARTIQVEVKSVLTDYQAQGTDKDGVLQGEQAIESISKQVSNVTLNGSRMADSWIAPDGTFYALMVLGEADFTTAVTESPEMKESVKQVVIAVAPKLFSAYDDETSAY